MGAVDATSINAFKSKLEGLRYDGLLHGPVRLALWPPGGIPASEAAQGTQLDLTDQSQ